MKWKLVVKIAVSVLLFLFFLTWVDVFTAFQTVSVTWGWFFLGLIVLLLSQFLKAVRFGMLSNKAGIVRPYFTHFLIHNVVTSFGLVTPGKLGEGGKLFYYKDADKKALGVCYILEKFSDSVVFVVFSLFLLAALNLKFLIFVLLGVLSILVLGIFFLKPLITRFFPQFDVHLLRIFSISNFLMLGGQALLIWLAVFFTQYLFAFAVGLEAPFFLFCQIMAASSLLGILSGLPGGGGSRELNLTFLFTTLLASDKGIVGAFAIVNLFGQYTVLGILAFASHLMLKRR